MYSDALSFQELGNSRLLIYKEDVSNLNFKLEIPHVLPIVRTTFIGSPLCYFDISNLISLENLRKFMLDKFDLLKVLKISTQVALDCTKQGIGLEELLFNQTYTFVDAQFNTYFIPLKIPGNTLKDVRTFLKEIITDSIIDTKYADNFVQLLLNCFNEENFSLQKLSLLIDDMISTKDFQIPENLNMIIEPQDISEDFTNEVTDTTEKDAELSDFLSKHLAEEKQKKQEAVANLPLYNANKSYPNTLNSGFAPVFSGLPQKEPATQNLTPEPSSNFYQPQTPPPTSTLSQSENYTPPVPAIPPPAVGYLFPAEDPHTPIALSATPFRIGRNPELVEYVINSPYIGRIHAYIERENDQYYLSDNKSTNGTFLNTYRIPPEQRVPLKNGDIIRFAKHAFQFVWQPNQ